MDLALKGKRVLVTGSTTGIGEGGRQAVRFKASRGSEQYQVMNCSIANLSFLLE